MVNSAMEVSFLGVLFLVLVLAVAIGLIVFQIFLSKMERKWFGLIIPILFFGISMITVFGVVGYTFIPGETVVRSVSENGEIVNLEVLETSTKLFSTQNDLPIAMILIVGFILNIPTMLFLFIFAICREKRKKGLEIDKMNIQDLE